MVTTEERLQILKMLEEGKITSEEAAGLLEALGEKNHKTAQPETSGGFERSMRGGKPRWFRVRVTDTDTGKSRVNVRMPIGVVRAGMKMGMKFAPEVEGLDMEELISVIQSGEMGKMVDVYDDEDGEHVEVYIE